MKESIQFYLVSGGRHPGEEKLQQGAFAQLIAEQLKKFEEAFGVNRTVEFRFSDDEKGMLKLKVIDEPWGHCFTAEISLNILTAAGLPDKFKQDVAIWFDQAALSIVQTREAWGKEK